MSPETPPTPAEVRARRKAFVKETLRCPHCDRDLERWELAANPLSDLGTDHLYVCFDVECPYMAGSPQVLAQHGTPGGGYCFVYNPVTEWIGPMPIRVQTGPQG